jgi:aminoglycoside phosphotransferase (APT) family kinase protein
VRANIPNYLYVAKNNSFAGYPIVPGDILTKKDFDKLSKIDELDFSKQLASLLSSLHTVGKRAIDLDAVVTSYMPHEQSEVKKLAVIYLSVILSPKDCKIVREILSAVDEVLARLTPAVFIHGDIYSNHILWDSHNKKLGLIDFSDMTIADPAIDFAELYEYGRAFVARVF